MECSPKGKPQKYIFNVLYSIKLQGVLSVHPVSGVGKLHCVKDTECVILVSERLSPPVIWPVDGGICTRKCCPPMSFKAPAFPGLPVAGCPCVSRGQRSERHLIRPHYPHHHSALISPAADASLGLEQTVLCLIDF